MALPLRVLRYKSAMQSETRSLRAMWSRVTSGIGSPWATWSARPWRLFWTGSKQAQRVGQSADNDAVQSLWQREGNYLGVLRTNQKRMEATLGPKIFPRYRNLRQLYAHCALNTCFYPFHCAIIALSLRFVGLFALILRPHCAATETVALMIMSKVLFRCFQLLHNAFMLWFHFRLTFSTPLHCSRQSADQLRLF